MNPPGSRMKSGADAVYDRSTSESTLDPEDRIVAGECGCSYFYTGGPGEWPCRALHALRNNALGSAITRHAENWFKRVTNS